MTEYKTIGELLDNLTGHGVYDIALVTEQFPAYGFAYDVETDQIGLGGQWVSLGAMTKQEFIVIMAEDPRGGIMDSEAAEDRLMIDALQLSEAVFRLLMPGQDIPSFQYNGRNKGFRVNVAAIRQFESEQLDN